MQEPRSKLYKVEAINLRTSKIGEADKIVVLFSRSRGKIHAIAKGARKPKSKFGGRLEPLAYNYLMLARGKEFDILSQAETIETFYEVRSNIEKLSVGLYFARLIEASLDIGQKNEALFDIFLECLRLLKGHANIPILKKLFEVSFIDIEGFYPVLNKCVKCGKMVTLQPKTVRFNFLHKGILCSLCSKKHGGIEIPYRVVRIIETLKKRDTSEIFNLDITEEEMSKLDFILKNYISEQIGKDITSW